MEESGDDYVYLPLVDAMKAVGQNVNLFAVITEINVPRKSKGTDYVLTLKIADESYQKPGLSVNFFSRQVENLPGVRSFSDIICLRCVMMKIHNGKTYIVFNKRSSSFALFHCKGCGDSVPYGTSAEFHGLPQDERFIVKLRSWLHNHPLDAVSLGVDDYTLQLCEIRTDKIFDLVCKVLHICQTSKGEWVIFAWDGTDTPPVSIQTDLVAEAENPCPLHVEEFSLSRNIIQAFPCVGTVLRVFSKEFYDVMNQLQDGDQWVRFRNIVCSLHCGIWKGMLHGSSSKICVLSHQDNSVLLCQRSYNARISAEGKLERLCLYPQPSNVIETDYEDVENVTLMQSLSHAELTHKFKCIVRVVAAFPWNGEDLWSSKQGQYRLRLTLEDSTARIHSYIHEGVKFFDGHPPGNNLVVKMNKLLGIDETSTNVGASRNPPWVSMCLKSYYLDKNDPWGSRRYQVFGTKLIG